MVVVSQQSSVGVAWAIACFILTKLGGNFVSRAAVVSQLSSVVLLGRSCCIFDETLWKFRHQRRLAHTPAVVSRQSCFIFDENQWGLRHQIRGPVGESEDLEHARLHPGTVPPPLYSHWGLTFFDADSFIVPFDYHLPLRRVAHVEASLVNDVCCCGLQ